MKKVKKIVAMALSMLLAAGVMTGCGGSKETSSNGKDTVVVWTYPHYKASAATNTPGYEDLLKQLIAKYKKSHPNVNVKYEILSWEDGDQKFDIALNSGNPPDLYCDAMQTKYIKTGLAIPLDKYMTKEDKKDFNAFALSRYNVNGKQYGLPMWIAFYCWGGNKKMMEDAGVDWKKIQQNGWTWDEFIEDAKKMTKTVDGKKVYGFVSQGKTNELFTHMLLANGLPSAVTKDGKYQYTGSKVTETLSFIKSLMDQGVMPKEIGGFDEQKEQDMFNNLQDLIL